MTRRSAALAALLVVLVPLTVVPAPVAGAPGDVQQIEAGDAGHPTWVVSLAEDASTESVEVWANSSSSRTLLSANNTTGLALVAAPAPQTIQFGLDFAQPDPTTTSNPRALLTDALAEKSYIAGVAPNYRASYADPITDLARANETAIDLSRTQRLALALDGGADPDDLDKSGLAFSEDAEETTPTEVRSLLGVDDVSATGEGVTVAVVDTGCNVGGSSRETAGELFGNGTQGSDLRISNASKDYVEGETVAEDGIGAIRDPNGHGTWVASQILANSSNDAMDGIAPDAELLCLRTLDGEGSGSMSDTAAAIRYAVEQDADVISMSLGSPVYSEPVADAVQAAYDADIPVVVAAGNSRFARSPGIASPADADRALAVAATNESGTPAYFSQAGPDPGSTDNSVGASQGATPDVAAIGMDVTVRVARTDGTTTNRTLSGTSMATPQVSGIAALVLADNPTLSAADVYERIEDGAVPQPEAATVEVGNGLVDAGNAITDDEPADEQRLVMTDAADRRDSFYRALSGAAGVLVPLAAAARAGVVA